MSATDLALLERWQRQRDADAFAELVQRYSGMVMGCCARILGDRGQAEDVAQECFIALMQSRGRVKSSLGAWLHTLAVRRSLDCRKSHLRRHAREEHYAEGQPAVGAPTDASLQEILAGVDEAIAGLPPQLHTVVVARFLDAQTHTELARQLGVAESTIRYRVEQGVEQIREDLKRRGIVAAVPAVMLALSQAVEAAPAELVRRLAKIAASGAVPAAVVSGLSLAKVALGVILLLAAAGAAWLAMRGAATPDTQFAQAVGAALKPAQTAPGDPRSETAIEASAPALQSSEAQSSGAVPGSSQEPAEFSIAGRIHDAKTGEGIPSAKVSVTPAGGGRYLAKSAPTEPDGRYFIPRLPDGAYTLSLDEVKGYPDPRRSRRISVTLTGGEPQSGVDFALDPGIPVSGSVVAKDGKPVSGVEVGARTGQIPNPLREETDAEGHFTLYLPEPAVDLMLQAQSDEAESSPLTGLKLTPAGLSEVTLMLDRPKTASVEGVVVDGDGNGIDGAQIHPLRKDQGVFSYAPSGEADSQGRFRLAGFAAGEYGFVVTPRDSQGFSTSEEYFRTTLTEGEKLTGVRIVYGEKGGLAIAGRVVNSTGVPIQGARVSCYGDVHESAHTDANGSFTLTGLSDQTYSISAEHHEYSRGQASAPAGTLDLEIVLKGQGGLAGHVTRADTGAPLTKFSLAFVYGTVRDLDWMLFGSGQSIESPEGAYSFAKLGAGAIAVAAWAPGFAPAWQNATVEEGAPTQVDFQLKAVPPFEGVVIDQAGKPVAEALVFFVKHVMVDTLDRATAARSGDDGRFVVESLPEAADRLCAYRPGYGIGAAQLPGEHRIVLPAAAVVEGTIENAGVAFSDLNVNAYYPDNAYFPSLYVRPNADGSFRMIDLSPGALEVSVYPNQGNRRQVSKTIRLEAGQTYAVALAFEQGTGIVRGKLLAGDGPVTSGFIQLRRNRGEEADILSTSPDAEGAFEFTRVWEGELHLKVTRAAPSDPYTPVVDEFTLALEEGETLEQDFELPPLP